MDWAVDQLGNLIDAAVASAFSYSLCCPCCREPVFRKRGPYRRAHFSHYSNGGSPECEEYHPGVGDQPNNVGVRRDPPSARPPKPYVRAALRISARPGTGFRLGLTLPRLNDDDTRASGEINLTSAVGLRTYSASHLARANFAFLPPAVPLCRCGGTGDLALLAEELQALTQEFGSFNVFNDIDVSGRLLTARDTVSEGEIYCVLSANPIPLRLASVSTSLESGFMGTWHYARFEIRRELSDPDKRALSEMLGRGIGKAVARLEILWPIPHHVDPGGTSILPSGTECLWILPVACVGHEEIEVRTSTSRRNSFNAGAGPIQIDLSNVEEAAILLDGIEQLTVRQQECAPFLPEGVRLASTDSRLIEGLTAQVCKALRNEPVLACPSDRVAQFIARKNPAWSPDGKLLRLSGTDWAIDADSFGRISYEPPVLPKEEHPPAIRGPKAVWIESLLAGASSTDLVSLLPWGKRPDTHRLTSCLLDRELAWLAPHINSAFEESV